MNWFSIYLRLGRGLVLSFFADCCFLLRESAAVLWATPGVLEFFDG